MNPVTVPCAAHWFAAAAILGSYWVGRLEGRQETTEEKDEPDC